LLLLLFVAIVVTLKGQGPDPVGVCGPVTKTPNVNVGGGSDGLSCGVTSACASLNYGIYGVLDSGSLNPTIVLVGASVLNQTVDLTGNILFLFFFFF
jgi:hypothetical protein